jgi:NTE family protein
LLWTYLTKAWWFIKEVWMWLYHRLPRPFSFSFVGLAIVYFLFIFPFLAYLAIPELISLPFSWIMKGYSADFDLTTKHFNPSDPTWWLVSLVNVAVHITSALLTLAAGVVGLLLSYWFAGTFYRFYRRNRNGPRFKTLQELSRTAYDNVNPLEPFSRIGIILAGGGAKGAYQAGAMQAIYEFIDHHQAHHKVKMIAGTSIGSWNALFWLSGLMTSRNGAAMSPLQEWWGNVAIETVIQPIAYLPTRQNYFLSNQPWQESFDLIFGDDHSPTKAGERLLELLKGSENNLHFYFTRTNIRQGTLSFTTNRRETVEANLPTGRSRNVIPDRTLHLARSLEDIRDAVFSSMDLPPLFQYVSINNEICEDGGVVDNLPIRFGSEFDNCDLLFVLPLNATFESDIDERSLIKRLARVTNIRQGVLERNSFKMVYLFNELACLRNRLKESEKKANDLENKLRALEANDSNQAGKAEPEASKKTLIENRIAERALKRTHEPTYIFSVCPAPKLLINTTEFWKTEEAGAAFGKMFKATQRELTRFEQIVLSERVRMLQVHQDDTVVPFTDF